MAKFQPTEQQLEDARKQDRSLGIPEGTTARQIEVESGWNPHALSGKGAMGYVQVVPKTLESISARVGRDLNPADWNDALTIHGAVMKENLGRWGNLDDALRAYNAGWNPRNWDNPETNGYIQKITGGQGGAAAALFATDSAEKLGTYGKSLQDLETARQFTQGAEYGQATPGSEALTPTIQQGLPDADAIQLANRTANTSGFLEATVAAATNDTLTAALWGLQKRGMVDPQFDPFSESRRAALEAEGLYGDQTARDHIGASINEEDYNARVQDERDRRELMSRMANTDGLAGAGVVAGQFLGSMADPVAIIGSLGAGAAVAALRGAGAATRAAMIAEAALGGAVENVAQQYAIDQVQGTRFDWASMAQQAAFGAGLGALGGVIGAREKRAAEGRQEQPGTTTTGADAGGDLPGRHVNEEDPLDAYMQGSQAEVEDILRRKGDEAYNEGVTGHRRLDADEDGLFSSDFYDIYGPARTLDDDLESALRGWQDETVSIERDKVRRGGDDISEDAAGVRSEEHLIEQKAAAGAPDVPVNEPSFGRTSGEHLATDIKSGREELTRLTQTAKDPLIKQLAGRLLSVLKTDVKIEVIKKSDATPMGGRPHYEFGSNTVRVAPGDGDWVMLHELAHAGTALKLEYGKANPDSVHGQLYTQFEELRKSTRDAWAALTDGERAKRMTASRRDFVRGALEGKKDPTPETIQKAGSEAGAVNNVDYYFQDVHEFAAGLYSGDNAFVRFLAGLHVPATGQNFLTKAVQIVKDLLGLTNVQTNALARAMHLVDEILESPLNTTLRFGTEDRRSMSILQAPPTPASIIGSWTTTALQQKVLTALSHVNISRNANKATEGLLSGLGYVDKKTGGWLVTPAQRLSQSASEVVRRAGALLFENAAGTDARNNSVSINYERLRRGYTDQYLMDVEKNLIEAMTPGEKAKYLTGFGAKEVIERIDTAVAELRFQKRMAIAKGGNMQYPQTPVGRIAAVMDEQVRRVTDEGIKAGNQHAKDVSGTGWVGFMPQTWKWDKFANALRTDRKTWDAVKKNFTEQYTEMIVDPAIAKATAAGANTQELAAIRAAMTKQVEARVETRMGEAIRDPGTRGNRDDTKFAKIAAELLEEQFDGQPVTPQVVADFRKALGDIVKDRTRTEFDTLRVVDGVRLLDFLEHGIIDNVQHIGHRFAGQNAMAKAGLKDPHYFDALMDLAAKDGASQADMEDLAFAGRAYGFLPSRAADMPALAALRNFAYSAMMGKLGFSQLADLGAIASNLGVGSLFRMLPRTLSREPELVKQLGRMSLSLVGQDYRLHRLTADVLPDGRAMQGGLQSLQIVSNRAAGLVSHLSLSNLMNKTLHKAFLPTMMEDLTRAVQGRDGGMSARRLADAGIDAPMAQRIAAQLSAHDAGRKAGDAFNWDNWTDAEAMDSFIAATQRITYQTFQRSLVGESQAWRSENAVGILFGQFRGFGLTAMEKSAARNLNIADAQAFVGLALSTALGAAMAYGRIEMNTLGMSDAKAREYRKKQTGFAFTKLVLNNVNQSGMLGDAVSIGELVFGGNSRGQQAGFEPPAVSLVGGLGKVATQAGAFLTGEGDVKKLSQSVLRIAPGGNTYAGTWLLNQTK
ncbi:putative transglycosylase [Ralstonia phage BHDT_So9]|uniref:Transglycosylase n=1 Tax=Ralstonia phage BHDT_So9 TaxID=2972464 RepID=A0A9E7U8C0_9CAUD|nr:putative transglycosylase [Ralstonia phage BHDT_So9]UWI83557.1 putative transglycosylase [Ralstonia phage DLDT_So2]UZT26944.1 putative transglycosylase [Ralstonia phage BHDTSo81]WEM03426.1 peptidoglycan lytic exotransglycosylase [Ralstonia phage BHDT8]